MAVKVYQYDGDIYVVSPVGMTEHQLRRALPKGWNGVKSALVKFWVGGHNISVAYMDNCMYATHYILEGPKVTGIIGGDTRRLSWLDSCAETEIRATAIDPSRPKSRLEPINPELAALFLVEYYNTYSDLGTRYGPTSAREYKDIKCTTYAKEKSGVYKVKPARIILEEEARALGFSSREEFEARKQEWTNMRIRPDI